MPTDRNNQNFKRIVVALELSDRDVVEIMAAAGEEVSRSKANAWGRGKHATREHTDGRDGAVFTDKRYRQMTNYEFDMFCKGLPEYYKSIRPRRRGKRVDS